MNEQQSPGFIPLAEALSATLENEFQKLASLHTEIQHQLDAVAKHDKDALSLATGEANYITTALLRQGYIREHKMKVLGRLLKIETTKENATVPLSDLISKMSEMSEKAIPICQELQKWQSKMITQAKENQLLGSEVAFQLQYAAQLGEDMIYMLRSLATPPPTPIYTSAGDLSKTDSDTPMMDKKG